MDDAKILEDESNNRSICPHCKRKLSAPITDSERTGLSSFPCKFGPRVHSRLQSQPHTAHSWPQPSPPLMSEPSSHRTMAHSHTTCKQHHSKKPFHLADVQSLSLTILRTLFFLVLLLFLCSPTNATIADEEQVDRVLKFGDVANIPTWNSDTLETVDYDSGNSVVEDSHPPPPAIPDQTALVGRLFFFWVPSDGSQGFTVHFQASEAGLPTLPQWLHINGSSGLLSGVPLSCDTGRRYISVDVRYRSWEEGKSLHVENSIFVLEVSAASPIGESTAASNTRSESLSPELNSDSPQSNQELDPEGLIPADIGSCSDMGAKVSLSLSPCPSNQPPVLANMLFYVNFSSLSSKQRTDMLMKVSKLAGICPQGLFLRLVKWSEKEGEILWEQLASDDFVDYLNFATIFSFPVACGTFDPLQEPYLTVVARLESSLLMCEDGLTLEDAGGNGFDVPYEQWFITTGSNLNSQSKSKGKTIRDRLKRQIDVMNMPVEIEMVATATVTEEVSSTPLPSPTSVTASGTSVTSLTTSQTSLMTPSSSIIIVPSSRVIPSSEASRAIVTQSPTPSTFPTSLPTIATTTIIFDVATTSIVFSITPTPTLSRARSFSIRSSIDIPTSSFEFPESTSLIVEETTSILLPDLTTSIPPDLTSTPVPTTAFPSSSLSSSVMPTTFFSLPPSTEIPTTTALPPQPTTSTLMVTSTPVSASESILLPMSSSELTASISIFTPTPVPSRIPTVTPELTTEVIFPSDTITSIPIFSPSLTPVETSTPVSPTLLSTQIEVETTSILLPFTSVASTTSVPFFSPETSFLLTATTSIQPSPSILMPMPTSDLTLSLSIFTPSPLFTSSATPDLTTSEITFIFPISSEIIELSTPSMLLPFTTATASLATSVLPLTSAVLTPTPTPSPSPVSICEMVECVNGVCVDLILDFRCDCFVGWTGEFCETDIDFCTPPPLGPCSRFDTVSCEDGNDTYTCNCIPGIMGMNCTEDIDGCEAMPCLNNGTCTNWPSTFDCECLSDYTGELCEIDITPCDPDPCMSNETCMELGPGSFVCIPSQPETTTIITSSTLTPFISTTTTLLQTTIQSSPLVLSTSVQTTSVSVATSFSPSVVPTSSPMITHVLTTSVMPFSSSPVSSTPLLSPSVSIAASPTPSVVPTSSPMITPVLTTSVMPFSSFPVPSTPLPSPSVSVAASPTPVVTTSLPPSLSLMPTPSPSPVSNNPPILLNPIGTIIANEGQVFRFSIPETTFFDPEGGLTSNLTLSLTELNGTPPSNTSWIQLTGTTLEGLPLTSEIESGAITEHVFIIRAEDASGGTIHDFINIRIFPQAEIANFLVLFFEGDFQVFSQNLSAKLDLVTRLASFSGQSSSEDGVYVKEFREGSIGIAYNNLSISDFDCVEFRVWVETIFINGEYADSFSQVLAPFSPISVPVIEGPCNDTDATIPPTLGSPTDIDSGFVSERVILLATVIPALFVALILLVIGIAAFVMYRRRRSERELLDGSMEGTYLNRRPVVLPGETELPPRGRHPVILANELAHEVERRERGTRAPTVLEEIDQGLESESSDEEELRPFLSPRHGLLQPVHSPPPPYELPPEYVPP